MTLELRRYENRKLYDPASSTYVSLADVRDAIAGGEDVCVLEHADGRDVTVEVLGGVIVSLCRTERMTAPVERLHLLIRGWHKNLADQALRAGRHVKRLLHPPGAAPHAQPAGDESTAELRDRVHTLEQRLAHLEALSHGGASTPAKGSDPA
ncbi:MAG: hypothetical protein H6674_10165 [Dehalococcoidia bacterium]|nr:hypothetical protein [Dehalococcoidia bacterium]